MGKNQEERAMVDAERLRRRLRRAGREKFDGDEISWRVGDETAD